MVSVHISLPQNQVPVQTIQQKISYEKGVKQLTDMVSSVQSSSVIFIMELRLAYAFCTCVLFNILMLCQIRHVQCLGVPSTTRSTYSTLDGKICYKCRPGQHLVENCTNSGEDAKCRSCPSGTFQSGENIAQNCTKCTLSCNNAHKKTNSECNGTTDLICQCVPGYFSGENNTCKQHSTCPPGQGVKEKGNVNTDTVCEPCIEGKFSSNDSATETCKPCTRCEEQGYSVTAPCMPERDTTCEPKGIEERYVIVIAVVSALVILVLVFVIVWCCIKRRQTKNTDGENPGASESIPLDPNGRDNQSVETHRSPTTELNGLWSRQSEDQRNSEGMPIQSERNSFNDHNNENVSDSGTTNPPNLIHSEPFAIGGGDSSSGPVVNSDETGPNVSPQEGDICNSEGNALSEHFDVCIISADDDEKDVYKFKDQLEEMELKNGQHPKICLFGDARWSSAGMANSATFTCKHCTLIFVYLSENFKCDEYAQFFQNQSVMMSLKSRNVRPVLSKRGCTIPTPLRDATPIKWYDQESRSFKENILSLFESNIGERLRREKMKIESILTPY